MKNRHFPEDTNAESAITLIRIQRNQALRDKYPSRRIEGPLVTLPPREDDKGFWFMNAFRMVWHTVLILIYIVGMSAGCHRLPKTEHSTLPNLMAPAIVSAPPSLDSFTMGTAATFVSTPDSLIILNSPKSGYKVEIFASRTTETKLDRLDRLRRLKVHRCDSIFHLIDSIGKILDGILFKVDHLSLDSVENVGTLTSEFHRNKAMALGLLHSADSTLTDNKIYQ